MMGWYTIEVNIWCMIVLLAGGVQGSIVPRDVRRHSAQMVPGISARWIDDDTIYTLRHPNLELGPLFSHYNPDYLSQYIFPEGVVQPRYSHDAPIVGAEVYALLEDLVSCLERNTRYAFTHPEFVVLKSRDYNPRTHSGLIILRFKRFPLVVKLFMETPRTFVSPFSKGFEPSIFFMMGGGINRYLSGYARIENASYILEQIHKDPYWSSCCDVPRKWIWQPCHQRFFILQSHNLGSYDRVITLPSVYGIICDAIESDESCKIFNKAHRKRALSFAHYLGIRVDPHIDNFMIEKGTGKLVLVDTEHFPTMVGLREPLQFNSYFEWYTKLSWKGFFDCFGRTKAERKRLQSADESSILSCKGS